MDRWVSPVSKYWMYRSHAGDVGPVILVPWRQHRVALPPLLQWLVQERNWVRTRRSVNRRAVDCVGSPFSQEQWLCPSLLMISWKVAIRRPREIHMIEGHKQTEREKRVVCRSGFPLQGVHRFESPWLLDMSTSCLWQSSHSKLMSLI
jgi:hypothetical protein